MPFEHPNTCSDIDIGKKAAKESIEEHLQELVEEICPMLKGQDYTDFVDKWKELFFEDVECCIEEIRTSNEEMRSSAESQVDKLDSEIEELQQLEDDNEYRCT